MIIPIGEFDYQKAMEGCFENTLLYRSNALYFLTANKELLSLEKDTWESLWHCQNPANTCVLEPALGGLVVFEWGKMKNTVIATIWTGKEKAWSQELPFIMPMRVCYDENNQILIARRDGILLFTRDNTLLWKIQLRDIISVQILEKYFIVWTHDIYCVYRVYNWAGKLMSCSDTRRILPPMSGYMPQIKMVNGKSVEQVIIDTDPFNSPAYIEKVSGEREISLKIDIPIDYGDIEKNDNLLIVSTLHSDDLRHSTITVFSLKPPFEQNIIQMDNVFELSGGDFLKIALTPNDLIIVWVNFKKYTEISALSAKGEQVEHLHFDAEHIDRVIPLKNEVYIGSHTLDKNRTLIRRWLFDSSALG